MDTIIDTIALRFKMGSPDAYRQIVPLADSTIYELERRGEFPQRFYLTARCVVWDLAEVMDWLQSRRQAGSSGVKKAPMPDYRQRGQRPIKVKS
ncbi:MAG: AlpA family phage regulatory protein [Burkholderiaceae bacterium]